LIGSGTCSSCPVYSGAACALCDASSCVCTASSGNVCTACVAFSAPASTNADACVCGPGRYSV
jgi:hypothetical protein